MGDVAKEAEELDELTDNVKKMGTEVFYNYDTYTCIYIHIYMRTWMNSLIMSKNGERGIS
jgi:hypothetical protein